MQRSTVSVRVNGSAIREFRLQRGWTQRELAKRAGYTDRLVRKAESGGSLSPETLENLAIALSVPGQIVSQESLKTDILSVVEKWVMALKRRDMNVEAILSVDLAKNFLCFPGTRNRSTLAGLPGMAGLKHMLSMHIKHMHLNYDEVEYASGSDIVVARMPSMVAQEKHKIAPARVNICFRFDSEGISRIEHEYGF